MDISIILCTYNNAERLSITLDAFCELKFPKEVECELVLVNNNSTDDTEEVIRSFVDRLPIIYVYEPEQGISRARNAGLDVAEGDLIVFTDDDVKPTSEWLIAYWESYRERTEGYYFGGPIESEFEGEPPDEDLLEVAMPSVAGLDYGPESREEDFFVGANWACPSKHLEKVGGFNEKLGLNARDQEPSVGEERDIMRKLREDGKKGWYIPKARIKHFVPEEKCSLDHVVSRLTGESGDDRKSESSSPSTVFGVPLGMYKAAVNHFLSWKFREIMGGKWKRKYIGWRIWKKRIKKYHSN